MKPGTYVTDRTASGRYYPRVYRVVRVIDSDLTEVCDIGDVVNGRLTNFARGRDLTYRRTEDLRVWSA